MKNLMKNPFFYALVLGAVFPLYFVSKIVVDNSPSNFFMPESEIVKRFDMLKESFKSTDRYILIFKDQVAFSPNTYNKIKILGDYIKNFDYVDNLFSPMHHEVVTTSEDGFDIEQLVQDESFFAKDLQWKEKRIREDRMAQKVLFGKDDKRYFSVVVNTSYDITSHQQVELDKRIMEKVSSLGLKDKLVGVSGGVSLLVEEFKLMLQDTMITIPLLVFFGIFLIYIQFPNLIILSLIGLTLMMISTITLSIYFFMGWSFDIISNLIPPMILSLSIAFLMHLLHSIDFYSKRELNWINALKWGVRKIRKPALLTSLTTSIGLASLATSDIPPINHFGITSAIGVLVIYFVCVELLPRCLCSFNFSFWKRGHLSEKFFDKTVKFFSDLGMKRYKAVLLITFLSGLICLPQVFKVKAESSLLEFFKKDHLVTKSNELYQEKFLGTNVLDIIVEGEKEPMSIENLNNVRRFREQVSQYKEVDEVFSVIDFIEDMHWSFNNKKEGFRVVPKNQNLIEQYLLVYGGDGIYDYMTRDRQRLHISIMLNVHKTSEIHKITERIKADIRSLFKDPKIKVVLAGGANMISEQSQLIVDGQMRSLILSVGLIFLFLSLFWRSITQGLVTMIPNLAPIVAIFVLMGFLGIYLDMATALIASIAVGIAVDDTIHVFHSIKEKLKEGESLESAISQTYQQTGRALISTTTILCIQFYSLIFSSFIPTRNFGVLTATGMLFALLFDLIVLPAMLIALSHRPKLCRRLLPIMTAIRIP